MKKFILILAVGITASSSAQWQWQQVMTGQILQVQMTFLDADMGFMVGTNAFPNGNALIARTTNGGASWTTVYSQTPAFTPSLLTMNDIQMVDQNNGFACGGGIDDPSEAILVKTTNGGTSWEEISHNIAISKLISLHFFDASNGLIASAGLWRTTNGGLNWTPVTLPSGVYDLKDLHFVNASLGFGVGNTTSALIRTTDGGETWSPVNLPTTEDVNEVYFFDEDHGLLAADNGVILYSSDGGLTWNAGSNPDPDQDHVYCVTMTSASVGYAGATGRILHTTNGGQTWTVGVDVQSLNGVLLIASINDIEFPNSQTGYACGSLMGTLVKTTNAGGIVGISELVREELGLVPNPAHSHISFAGQDVNSVQLFSAEGRLIKEYSISGLNEVLYVGDLSPGVYLLRTSGPNTVREGFFVKE